MSHHVAITRRVRPGCEAEFEVKLRVFAQASLSRPGTLGVQLLYPAPGTASGEYGILRSFASREDRDAFYASAFFTDWERSVAHLVEGGPVCRDLQGLEAWFREGGPPPPPRWKMAAATLLGVYPTSLLLGITVAPLLQGLPLMLLSLAMAAAMVACLTWVVMPAVTKLLRPWLHDNR